MNSDKEARKGIDNQGYNRRIEDEIRAFGMRYARMSEIQRKNPEVKAEMARLRALYQQVQAQLQNDGSEEKVLIGLPTRGTEISAPKPRQKPKPEPLPAEDNDDLATLAGLVAQKSSRRRRRR